MTTARVRVFFLQVGHTGNPIWEKGCSTDASARSAAIDESGVYRFAVFNELERHYIKTDPEGKCLWAWDTFARKNPWETGGEALTLVKGRVFQVIFDGTVSGHSAETGHCVTNGDSDPQPWNVQWNGAEVETKRLDCLGQRTWCGRHASEGDSTSSAKCLRPFRSRPTTRRSIA